MEYPDKLECPVCGQLKMYGSGEGVVQLDIQKRKLWGSKEWLTTHYRVYKCLNDPAKCKGSKKGMRYIMHSDGRYYQMKKPLRLYSPPYDAGE